MGSMVSDFSPREPFCARGVSGRGRRQAGLADIGRMIFYAERLAGRGGIKE